MRQFFNMIKNGAIYLIIQFIGMIIIFGPAVFFYEWIGGLGGILAATAYVSIICASIETIKAMQNEKLP